MHYTEKCPACGGSSVVIPMINGVQSVCCEGTLRTASEKLAVPARVPEFALA